MSRAVIAILVVLLVIAAGVSLTLMFFLLSSRTALDTPNPLAVTIAETGKIFLVPGDEQAKTNPVTFSPELLSTSRRTFTARCAICHGTDGKGDTPTGSHMYPRAADLTAARTQSKSDGTLHWIITNGLVHTGMPGWRDLLNEQQIWELVAFVRELPKGIPPEPTPTPPPAATAPSSSGSAGTTTVDISNSIFVQDKVTVAPGTHVVWVNHDDDEHTVTSSADPKVLDSPTLTQNQTFEFTFTEPGTYAYICTVHDYMQGQVIVQ